MQPRVPAATFASRAYCWVMLNSASVRTPDPFPQSCLPAWQPRHILLHRFIPPQVQDFALLFAELHEVPISPFLHPVEVPPKSSTTLWCISQSSQFCTISKLAESTHCPIIQITNEDVEQDWIQCWSQGYTASYWTSQANAKKATPYYICKKPISLRTH